MFKINDILKIFIKFKINVKEIHCDKNMSQHEFSNDFVDLPKIYLPTGVNRKTPINLITSYHKLIINKDTIDNVRENIKELISQMHK